MRQSAHDALNQSMRTAAQHERTHQAELQTLVLSKRPKLTAEHVEDYLDWITSNLRGFDKDALEAHLRAAELVIRTRATDAQAKATQHTLVEQGVMDAPPAG